MADAPQPKENGLYDKDEDGKHEFKEFTVSTLENQLIAVAYPDRERPSVGSQALAKTYHSSQVRTIRCPSSAFLETVHHPIRRR